MLLPNTKVEGRALCSLGICPNKSCLWANLHGFLQVQQTSPALLLQMIHESLLRWKTQHLMLPSVHTLWSGYILKQSQEWYTLQIISHRTLSPFGLRWCPHAPSNLPLPSNPIIPPQKKHFSGCYSLYLPASSSPQVLPSQNSYVET